MPEMVRRLAEVCKPVLEMTARKRRTIGYEELVRKVRLKVNLPELRGRDSLLHNALDIVSKDSYDGGQNLLLSVVVVRKSDGMPGVGFFHLARQVLGAYPVEATEEQIFST